MTDRESDNYRAREDEWLVVRCQLGERPAFEELIQRWHAPIWKYVRRRVSDDDAASEIAQHVWLQVMRGIGRLGDGAKLRAWLQGIVRHALTDRLRARYSASIVSDVDMSQIAADDSSQVLEEDLTAMREQLDRLPDTEREVLTLFYLQEHSLDEIAHQLAVPIGTVKSRLFRARRLLRHKLELTGGSP